jgi:hypothetical protein
LDSETSSNPEGSSRLLLSSPVTLKLPAEAANLLPDQLLEMMMKKEVTTKSILKKVRMMIAHTKLKMRRRIKKTMSEPRDNLPHQLEASPAQQEEDRVEQPLDRSNQGLQEDNNPDPNSLVPLEASNLDPSSLAQLDHSNLDPQEVNNPL